MTKMVVAVIYPISPGRMGYMQPTPFSRGDAMKRKCAFLLLGIFWVLPVWAAAPQKIIFDTDFVMPPQDDAMALLFALNCPELQILGVTTVSGNRNVERATVDALKVLEVAGRTEIPVYKGAARPLMHEKTEFDTKVYGGWWSDEPAPEPPGGFARKKAESGTAVDFIVGTVMQNP